MTTEIVVFQPTEAVLADLTKRYELLVFAVATPEGMAEAKAAYKDINQHAITLEKARVAEKEASLQYGRKVDAEAKRIAAVLDGLRLPIKEQIETETKRVEREREAAVAAEKARLEEEERQRKAAEQAELDRKRAEVQARAAALDKEIADARERMAQEERKLREEIEAHRRAQAAHQAEEDRKAREKEEVARKEREAAEALERAAAAAKKRAEDEEQAKRDAELREIRRRETELVDGVELLETFVARFGHREEFFPVTAQISGYLEWRKAQVKAA